MAFSFPVDEPAPRDGMAGSVLSIEGTGFFAHSPWKFKRLAAPFHAQRPLGREPVAARVTSLAKPRQAAAKLRSPRLENRRPAPRECAAFYATWEEIGFIGRTTPGRAPRTTVD
jgi:hypothetical protein